MNTHDERQFHERMQQIETLIQVIERSSDAAAQSAARALVQTLLDLHAAGLARMLEVLERSGQPGQAALTAFTGDAVIGSLLLLHGLHPIDLETRVRQALETVRPHVYAYGANVELVALAEGVVRLRINGHGHGCASSAQTFTRAIEEAIWAAAPDVTRIDVEGEATEALSSRRLSLPVLAGNSVQASALVSEGMGSARR